MRSSGDDNDDDDGNDTVLGGASNANQGHHTTENRQERSRSLNNKEPRQPAVAPPVEERVIGHDYCRRTDRDVAAEQYLRPKPVPRWQKNLSYRFSNTPRIRWMIFMLFLILACMSAVGLWMFDEARAGAFVSMAFLLLGGVFLCTAEIIVKCPKLTEGLFLHLGIIRPMLPRHAGTGPLTMTIHQEPPGVDMETGDYYGFLDYTPGGYAVDGSEYDEDDEGVAALVDSQGRLMLDSNGKPIYGDHARKVHSLGNQVERFGADVMNTFAKGVERIIPSDSTHTSFLSPEYQMLIGAGLSPDEMCSPHADIGPSENVEQEEKKKEEEEQDSGAAERQ